MPTVTIYQPHQIIRTTNRTGTVINSWVVNEDGTVETIQVGLNEKSRPENPEGDQ